MSNKDNNKHTDQPRHSPVPSNPPREPSSSPSPSSSSTSLPSSTSLSASAASLRFTSRLHLCESALSRPSPLIVAEISTNHRGSLDEACALVAAAARTGADAVKLQSYSASDLTLPSPRSEFALRHPLWSGRRLFELYEQGSLPSSWHEPLWRTASEHDIALFPSIFSAARLSLLEPFSPPAYKIASGELVDIPLLRSVARTGRFIILSTGMGDFEEVSRAVSTIRATSGSGILLLHCLSAYPAPSSAMNLRSISTLSREFSCAVGLSDHTTCDRSAIMSVALGACMIEKHFTLERREGDLDASFSLDEAEFARFVISIREAGRSMGSGSLESSEAERDSLVFRRSLYVVSSVRRGEIFSDANIRSIRPNAGLAPRHYDRVLGSRAAFDITAGEPLREEMIEEMLDKERLTKDQPAADHSTGDAPPDPFSEACARTRRFRNKTLGRSQKRSPTPLPNDTIRDNRPSCLAIIPARGGSKRIRDKNIVDFFGKPLLAHTLSYSFSLVGGSGIFTRAHVSTDSERIAEVARASGFTIDFMRDARLADDFTGVWDVVRWVLREYELRGERFDCVCLLYASTPLLDELDLRAGMDYFLSLPKGHHVMACCEYSTSPLRALSIDMEGNVRAIDKDSMGVRRTQDLESYVMDCGAFSYRWTRDVLDGVDPLLYSKTRAYILGREKGVDINTERDLGFAKLLYRASKLI